MTVEIVGVTLHPAHPDELPARWMGQEEPLRQLLASWLMVASALTTGVRAVSLRDGPTGQMLHQRSP